MTFDPWQPQKAYSIGDIVFLNGKTIQATGSGTSGIVKPYLDLLRMIAKEHTGLTWQIVTICPRNGEEVKQRPENSSPVCDCGGLKAGTTHSSWCSTLAA